MLDNNILYNRKRTDIKAMVLMAFYLIFLLLALYPSIAFAAGISVVPSSSSVSPGDTFYVDIMVDKIPSEGLGAVQFRLNVDAQGTVVSGISDISQGKSTEVSVATPILIGQPTPSRSGIGDFFLSAKGPNGILVMDNDTLTAGTGMYTFGHTSGATPPSGGGSVARFVIAVGRDVAAQNIAISLSEVMLLDNGTQYSLDSNSGTTIELRCVTKVPNLLGLSLSDAQTALQNAGLLVGNVSELNNQGGAYALNKVLTQSVTAGTTAFCQSPVDFSINIPPAEAGNVSVSFKTADESGTVVLSWIPSISADTAGYRVYLIGDQQQNLLKGINLPASTGLEISGLPYGRASQLKITAYDTSGNESQGVTVSATPGDDVPPTGSVSIGNSVYTNNAVVTLSLNASDGGSGVSKMCISNTFLCTAWENYITRKTWTLTSGDGLKTVYAWYQDKSGNIDLAPYSASITLDATVPVLTVSTLSDGSWTNNEVLNIAGTAMDNIGVQQVMVNGIVVTTNADGTFSYPVVLLDGQNTITIAVTDLAGNTTIDTRTINLDRSAPILMITTPADNITTRQAPIEIAGTVDEQSTVSVSVNGADPAMADMNGNTFGLSVTPVYGINTIEVTAMDRAGNTSKAKRTITFDDQNPSLAVTGPSEDIKTNQAVKTITGTVADLTIPNVTMSIDGGTPVTLTVDNGVFSTDVAFTTQTIYVITVTATDEVGNSSSVTRNIIYDATSPVTTATPAGGTYGTPQSVTLSCDDVSGSGCSSLKYCLGSGCTPETDYTGVIAIASTTVLRFFSTDNAGNIEDIKTETYTIDNMISVSAGANGSVTCTPNPVDYNTSADCIITPKQGYHVATLTVDGNTQAPATSYTFNNVMATHNIAATFAIDTFEISTNADVNGDVTCAPNPVNYGSSSTCTISSTTGYHIASVTVDGEAQSATSPYVFNDVTLTHTIAATFAINDITPPVTTATASGYTLGTWTSASAVNVILSASDAETGVASGYPKYCVDMTNSCTPLTSDTTLNITCASGKSCVQYVRYYSLDNAGNAEAVKSSILRQDLQGPALNVSTLSDNAWTNNGTLNVAGDVSDDGSALQELTINGVAITVDPDGTFSHAVVLTAGVNNITVIATDNVGNTTTDMRTINYDPNAPVIVIDQPVDNKKTNNQSLTVSGYVDEYSRVTGVTNNLLPITFSFNEEDGTFSASATLSYGTNTIEIDAADLAANTATAKRTVIFDNVAPALAITDPAQDITTAQASIDVQGTVNDLTIPAVTMTVDGGSPESLTIISGQFTKNINFTSQKTYVIQVTAVDEAVNTSTVTRNVIYLVDTTPAQFTFAAQTGVAVSTVTTSNTITVTGINSPAPISITGGTYAINGGTFTSAAGTVNMGDTVAVRQTSSSSYLTTTNANLTIGGVSGAFSVTTRRPEIAPVAAVSVVSVDNSWLVTISNNSTDPDGDAISIVSVSWGDGTVNTSLTHTYSTGGTKYITLTVSDGSLNSSATTTVNLNQYTISGNAGESGVTVTLSGSGTGTISSGSDGSYSFLLNPGTYTLTPSKIVSGVAKTFSPASITRTIGPSSTTGNNFAAVTPGLTITKQLDGVSTTNGTVSSAPTGISCGTGCSALYNPSQTIVLTSTAPSGKLTSWTGCDAGSGGIDLSAGITTCSVTMGLTDKGVTVNYTTPAAPVLTVTKTANYGSVVGASLSCGNAVTTCTATEVLNGTYTLTATPAAGHSLDTAVPANNWGPGCQSYPAYNKCSVKMDVSKTIQVNFQ